MQDEKTSILKDYAKEYAVTVTLQKNAIGAGDIEWLQELLEKKHFLINIIESLKKRTSQDIFISVLQDELKNSQKEETESIKNLEKNLKTLRKEIKENHETALNLSSYRKISGNI